MISACSGTSGYERTVNFRRLGIEINGLREIARRTPRHGLKRLEQALGLHYIDFKRHLTDDDAVDKGVASRASSEIRMTALKIQKIQWLLCKHVLDRTTDDDVFASE